MLGGARFAALRPGIGCNRISATTIDKVIRTVQVRVPNQQFWGSLLLDSVIPIQRFAARRRDRDIGVVVILRVWYVVI